MNTKALKETSQILWALVSPRKKKVPDIKLSSTYEVKKRPLWAVAMDIDIPLELPGLRPAQSAEVRPSTPESNALSRTLAAKKARRLWNTGSEEVSHIRLLVAAKHRLEDARVDAEVEKRSPKR